MKKGLLLLLLCGLLCGCQAQKGPTNRLVTRVDIQDASGARRTYTHPEKMKALLTYLRLLHPAGIVSPDGVTGAATQIRFTYADGFQTEITQRGRAYFLGEDRTWRAIDPAFAAALEALVHMMPPDSGNYP